MVQIDEVLISLDVFAKRFICDLPKCKGECCVEGESGAPLEDEETDIMEQVYPIVKADLSEKAIAEIEKTGTWEVDADGDKVTPIIQGKECVYTFFDEEGVCKCAIEKAWSEGKTAFRKPVSCQLYPIRMKKYNDFEAMNYDVWPICHVARELGSKVGMPVFRFLKEPIIRRFGEEFYKEMEGAEEELKRQGVL